MKKRKVDAAGPSEPVIVFATNLAVRPWASSGHKQDRIRWSEEVWLLFYLNL
jgi:hypothetical protein